MAAFPRFLAAFALAIFGMLTGIAGFCAAVDPYGVIGAPAIPGRTANKVAASGRQRMAKPSLVEWRNPATIIMGSSIANLGFDPDGPEWATEHRPVFNFGIDGASPTVQLQLLRHALVRTHPKRVILVVSFEDVLMPALRHTAAETEMFEFESRMRVLADGQPNPRYWLGRAQDLRGALLSSQALRDSLKTLGHQHDTWSSHLTTGGLDSGGRLDREIAAYGQDKLIASWLAELTQRVLRWQRAPAWPLDSVATMVAVAQQARAEVVLAIGPVRTEQLELRRQLGLGDAVRRWRVGLAELAAAAHAPLWDFGGVTPYGNQSPTEPGHWFYDTSHFRPALGALVAARVEGGGGEFGALLTPGSVDEHTVRTETNLSAWEKSNPAGVARVTDAIAEGRQLLCAREPSACVRSTVAVAR